MTPEMMTTDKPTPEADDQTPKQQDTASMKKDSAEEKNAEIEKYLKDQVQSAERNKKKFYGDWKRNVDLRLGKPVSAIPASASVSDDGQGDLQSEINPDWSLTKTKTANLYSQVPTVQVTHENKQYAPLIPFFAKALNYELGDKRCNVGVAMEEVLNDVVNAAGIGAVVVGYMARFDTIQIPVNEDDARFFLQLPKAMQDQIVEEKLVPMTEVRRPVSKKFYVTRVSPSNLLWDAGFTGSNFDDAVWGGYKDTMTWASAKHEFDLSDEDKERAMQASGTTKSEDSLRSAQDNTVLNLEVVQYKRLFYWRHKLDPDETSFDAIWEMVTVDGIPDPVRHQPWEGQQFDEQSGQYLGARKLPIRFLTLTYITDNPVPPSDSQAGRPQVNDMRRSRSQMFLNRERSFPIRGFNASLVDPEIRDLLMRGTPQGMIPFKGNAKDAMWEVARASYPAEDLTFDQQAKADLMESWQIGPNQMGTSARGDQTKAEVQTVQANFATRIGQERARVANFFLSIAEVLSGLMVLYSDFPNLTEQEKQQMMGGPPQPLAPPQPGQPPQSQAPQWDLKHVNLDIVLNIRPDATIMLDPNQRLQKLSNFLNLTVKSGLINPLPIIAEMAELSGIDPTEVLKQPDPPKGKDPTMTIRVNGKDDLQSPMIVAMLTKKGYLPTPQELDAAKSAMVAAHQPPQQPLPPGGHPQGPGPMNEAHPNWSLASKIAKRSRDMAPGS